MAENNPPSKALRFENCVVVDGDDDEGSPKIFDYLLCFLLLLLYHTAVSTRLSVPCGG